MEINKMEITEFQEIMTVKIRPLWDGNYFSRRYNAGDLAG